MIALGGERRAAAPAGQADGRSRPGWLPSPRPAAAGGDDDDVGAVVEDVRRGQASSGDHLDVGQLVELGAPPVGDAAPVAERRKPPRPADAPADLVLGVDEVDRRRSRACRARSRTPCRPARRRRRARRGPGRASGSNRSGCQPRRNSSPAVAFWMQPTCPKASSLMMQTFAPGALADVVEAALGDLAREERVGDRRAGRADEVEGAGADHGGHQVGVRVAADADDGLRRRLADAARPGQLVALGVVARGPGVLRPRARRSRRTGRRAGPPARRTRASPR